jgi:succinyl-CoA synthetase beta subunit
MARVKLSEYDAKRLLFPALNLVFSGYSAATSTTAKELVTYFGDTNLVVKVDQGIKKRGKLGLVKVNCTPEGAINVIKEWSKAGWPHFFVEPVYEHAESSEHYFSIERTRNDWSISYSVRGGIEVEKSWDQIVHTVPDDLRSTIYDHLIPALEQLHIVFLECNPILVRDGKLIPLDMAAEIDSAALNIPSLASLGLIPIEDSGKTEVERKVAELDASTPASLKFRLINPEGKIWMFLSGGGASLVLADEVADQGMGKELANYGEYSGAPTDDDVYAYTKIILQALLESTLDGPRAIVVAGGVANFTDVAKTFAGLIRALDEQKTELARAKVKVFVRRGGPNEVKGLKMMEDFLIRSKLLGSVHGHDVPLTHVVTEVKEYLQ